MSSCMAFLPTLRGSFYLVVIISVDKIVIREGGWGKEK